MYIFNRKPRGCFCDGLKPAKGFTQQYIMKLTITRNTYSSVLSSMPLASRRLFVQQVNAFLLTPATTTTTSAEADWFASEFHVQWTVECIGQGFSLPIEDWPIIEQSARIYSQWLLEKQSRPAVLLPQLQSYFQVC